MLNVDICNKCRLGASNSNWTLIAIIDKLTITWGCPGSVSMPVSVDSSPPDGCPYALEHAIHETKSVPTDY